MTLFLLGLIVGSFTGGLAYAIGADVRGKDLAWIKIGQGCRGMSPEAASELAAEVHKQLLKMGKKR